MSAETRARVIAFYLPQFHPIPENDRWWGRGFTEWTNVTRARPLFPGHQQPKLPGDLGFYDLRVPESREAQAELARASGIEAFCYWHYWFGGGRRILERPFAEVLASGKPDFPFCLAWANGSWTGIWHGAGDRILIDQTYPGRADYEAHFKSLLPAFRDPRYLRVDDKPVFVVFQPTSLPSIREFTELWRELAVKAGIDGVYLIGMFSLGQGQPQWRTDYDAFDAITSIPPADVVQRVRAEQMRDSWLARGGRRLKWMGRMRRLRRAPLVLPYDLAARHSIPTFEPERRFFPCIVPNWDNTPRSGRNGVVFEGSTPERFRDLLDRAVNIVRNKPRAERIVFVKAWNEWAEGNCLEPDQRYGTAYLDALKSVVVVAPIACVAAGHAPTGVEVRPGDARTS